MKAARIGAFLVFIFSAQSFAANEELSPAFIRVYATGTLPRSRSKHSSDLVQFALGNTQDQTTTDTSAIITLAPGEAYKGLLFLGRDDTTGLAKFETMGRKKYKFNPNINAFEIQDIENLGNSVAKPLASAFIPESNIDLMLNDLVREFHFSKDEKTHYLKLNIKALESCTSVVPSDLVKTLQIPEKYWDKIFSALEISRSSISKPYLSENGVEDDFLTKATTQYLETRYPGKDLAGRAVYIPCKITDADDQKKAPFGHCYGTRCVLDSEIFRTQEFSKNDAKNKTVSTCAALTEDYHCHSQQDSLFGSETDFSGLCHNQKCFDCTPEKIHESNSCKFSYFNPEDDKLKADALDCSNPPNKPDRTPCSGGLCFEGNCKAFSELTSAQQPNGIKCKQTKQYPQLRYYFDGICRDCDESTPSKLIGINNCTAHPGLPTWLPSRKSCSGPDICAYSQSAATLTPTETQNSQH